MTALFTLHTPVQWDLAAFCACTVLLLVMNSTAVYEMDRRAQVAPSSARCTAHYPRSQDLAHTE